MPRVRVIPALFSAVALLGSAQQQAPVNLDFKASETDQPPRGWLVPLATQDFDISLFKNFPWGEKRSVRVRVETFNTFNHPQFNMVDPNPQFDQSGNQVNGRLGQIISDYLPRQVQLALKVIF